MFNIKLSIRAVLSLFILCLVFEKAIASEAQYKVNVVTEYFEPYQVEKSDGQLGGFATEVIHALFAEANSRANIMVMPWARAYKVALKTPNTLIYSLAHTKKRQNDFHWVGSLTEEHLYYWGLKSNTDLQQSDITALKNFRVAATRKSNVAQYLQDKQFQKIYLLNKEDQNVLMLYRGRVDLIIATELTVQSRAEKLGLDIDKLVKISEVKELNNDLCVAFSKGTNPKMIEHFRQAFRNIKNSGKLESMQNKWLHDDSKLYYSQLTH